MQCAAERFQKPEKCNAILIRKSLSLVTLTYIVRTPKDNLAHSNKLWHSNANRWIT